MTIIEENYLKAIFQLSFEDNSYRNVGTNEIANLIAVKPATANSMLKKLKEKKLIDFQKYGKITLTGLGKERSIFLVRKHRLWETFLYEKLGFTWDEVHEVAEELEHVNSSKLIQKLDEFLGFPGFDPHGDPIPNMDGQFISIKKCLLSEIPAGKSCKMVAVKDSSATFLQYVVSLGLGINVKIKVVSILEYDLSTTIEVNGKSFVVSRKFTNNIFVV